MYGTLAKGSDKEGNNNFNYYLRKIKGEDSSAKEVMKKKPETKTCIGRFTLREKATRKIE